MLVPLRNVGRIRRGFAGKKRKQQVPFRSGTPLSSRFPPSGINKFIKDVVFFLCLWLNFHTHNVFSWVGTPVFLGFWGPGFLVVCPSPQKTFVEGSAGFAALV